MLHRKEEGAFLNIGVRDANYPRAPYVTKSVAFYARHGAAPKKYARCVLNRRSGDFDTVGCAARCPAPASLEVSSYCEGAGQLLPLPRFAAASRAARGGGVRIRRLSISGLPAQPPFAGPAVAVFCTGRGCPFGGRFFADTGGALTIRAFGRRALAPGTVIDVRVVKGNFIGRVQRYVVRRGRLATRRLCHFSVLDAPRRCPRG